MADTSFSRILAFWAERKPDAPAVSCGEHSATWAELEASTNRLARAYAELGVKEGDNVTIALPNSIEFVAATYAVWKLGATPQPVSSRLPVMERDAIIAIAKSSLVVGVDGTGDVASGVTSQDADFQAIPAGYQPSPELVDTALPERTSRYMKAMTSGGSTGRPKLIVARQPAAIDPLQSYLVIEREKSVLVPGPLYHNGPFLMLWAGLGVGNHVVFTERFDAAETMHLLDEYCIDLVYMVPTMMQRIWLLPEEVKAAADLSHLRMVFHLAAPISQWLKEAWIEWLGAERIVELYGGTEAQGFTIIGGEDWLQHRGSVGRPVMGAQMKIVAENGASLPPGEIGEIYILPESGAGTTYHYVGAEAKADAEGWESLGDMGYLDEEGFLYLTDRQTDMIICGGANIFPAEVEGAIEAFPGVRSCAVIGLPHEDLGNAVHAIIDMAGEPATEDDILSHLAERLVRYKIPRSMEFVNEPLRDDAGKVRRKALREQRLS
ncbi:MAG: AMP-binding protein [Gammaproteobacteria bacterium]|nr:AMP-binding protein [Gammaproteobacteria bacterium]